MLGQRNPLLVGDDMDEPACNLGKQIKTLHVLVGEQQRAFAVRLIYAARTLAAALDDGPRRNVVWSARPLRRLPLPRKFSASSVAAGGVWPRATPGMTSMARTNRARRNMEGGLQTTNERTPHAGARFRSRRLRPMRRELNGGRSERGGWGGPPCRRSASRLTTSVVSGTTAITKTSTAEAVHGHSACECPSVSRSWSGLPLW